MGDESQVCHERKRSQECVPFLLLGGEGRSMKNESMPLMGDVD